MSYRWGMGDVSDPSAALQKLGSDQIANGANNQAIALIAGLCAPNDTACFASLLPSLPQITVAVGNASFPVILGLISHCQSATDKIACVNSMLQQAFPGQAPQILPAQAPQSSPPLSGQTPVVPVACAWYQAALPAGGCGFDLQTAATATPFGVSKIPVWGAALAVVAGFFLLGGKR